MPLALPLGMLGGHLTAVHAKVLTEIMEKRCFSGVIHTQYTDKDQCSWYNVEYINNNAQLRRNLLMIGVVWGGHLGLGAASWGQATAVRAATCWAVDSNLAEAHLDVMHMLTSCTPH